MIKLFSLTTVLAHASDLCLAPHGNQCLDCTQPGDRIQQVQCVVGETAWFPCYRTISECCQDPQIMNRVSVDECVSTYTGTTSAPTTAPETHYNGDPNISDAVYCDRVLARRGTRTSWCQTKCKDIIGTQKAPMENSDFTDVCQYDHYEIAKQDGHIHFVTDSGTGPRISDLDQCTNTCFDHWVYGYSEPTNLAGYKVFQNITTPALCQEKCQEDSDCNRFTWTTPNIAKEDNDKAYQCILKNKKQVDEPLSYQYTSEENPQNYSADYCNYGIAYECYHKLYKCLTCSKTFRCVWRSEFHVAGFQTCDRDSFC